jgi:hypothetical protein
VGEINLMLVNLLKEAGLNAHPVLVSTHENGVVNPVDAGTFDYPGFHQFNKVPAYVKIDGRHKMPGGKNKIFQNPMLLFSLLLRSRGCADAVYNTIR